MHATKEYQSGAIRRLRDWQANHGDDNARMAQAARAELLLREIDPEKYYTEEYLSYRIRGYRPDQPGDQLDGETVVHDLRLLVEDLTDAADAKAEDAGEPVLTLDELSRMFNVSTKTISRWRQQGLVSRRYIFEGRKRVGFLSSSVDRFVEANRDRVKRGERFSQLTDADRDEIIDRARRMAKAGGTPADIARRIAKHMHRSVETIRYTIRQFDERNPNVAVFPDHRGPLTEETKHTIYQSYRRGESADKLAAQYCRTKTSIYRIIGEMRAVRILELPLDYMHNEAFEDPSNEAEIMAETPEPEMTPRKTRVPSGLPSYLMALYETPLLTPIQERHLFRKLNYVKYKASQLREGLEPSTAKASVMDEIEALYKVAVETKNAIVQANLRLVVSIAKRHVSPSDEFFQLVSDGNMSLIRAVEKFDFARGNKFSTYASWAIMKNYARSIPDEYKQRDRFRTSSEEAFTLTEDASTSVYAQETAQQTREMQVKQVLSHLDEREQQIIINRFGLNHKVEPQTLKQVGEEMGVTKERVRQLEARALAKLRIAAEEEHIDFEPMD